MSSEPIPELHAIVLAAGASTRFGSPKQLVRVQGRPVLHLVVARATEIAGHAVIIVLGAHAAELAPLLRHSPATIVVNREWPEGLASSIRVGIARLPPTCDAALLLLADQVAVSAEDLRRLASTWRRQPQSIVAAQYEGITGPPVIFPRADFPTLSELRGDQGARTLLHRSRDRVVRVPITSAAIDIDRPEDLLRLGDEPS
jgi:molybdenum cofactor cytidylyltransferase